MTLRGVGRLDLALWKSEAHHVPDDSPVSINDYDFNESMAEGEAELSLTLTIEMRVKPGNIEVSIE